MAKDERVGGKVKEVRAAGGGFGAMFEMSWRSRFGLIRKLGLLELGVKFVKYLGV